MEGALANLKEAVELYLEGEDNTLIEVNSILTTTFEVSYDKGSSSVST